MTEQDILNAIEATWPPSKSYIKGGWRFRLGDGGGKRVSAATPIDETYDIEAAEAEMAQLGQQSLFSLRKTDAPLDAALAENGYNIADPSILMSGPIEPLLGVSIPPITAFAIWPHLQIMTDIWAAGGIGAGRLAVMERVATPKTCVFGRINDRAAGTAFVAIHKNIAMVHAVEVLKEHRRHGLAKHMMRQAALWAADQGATAFALATTQANTSAQNLYSSLGMSEIGRYHYRLKP